MRRIAPISVRCWRASADFGSRRHEGGGCWPAHVVLPHGRDQADNAARVLARGVSGAVNRTTKAAAIADAAHRVLQDPSYRADAHRLKQKASTGTADMEKRDAVWTDPRREAAPPHRQRLRVARRQRRRRPRSPIDRRTPPAGSCLLTYPGHEPARSGAAPSPNTAEEVGSYLTVASRGLDALRAIDADGPVLDAGFPTPTNLLLSSGDRRLGRVSTVAGWRTGPPPTPSNGPGWHKPTHAGLALPRQARDDLPAVAHPDPPPPCLRLLAEGVPVTVVAARCGWATPSAFIDVFRRTIGDIPAATTRSPRRVRSSRRDRRPGGNSHAA
jgi:AraC-like DNA-binding protein